MKMRHFNRYGSTISTTIDTSIAKNSTMTQTTPVKFIIPETELDSRIPLTTVANFTLFFINKNKNAQKYPRTDNSFAWWRRTKDVVTTNRGPNLWPVRAHNWYIFIHSFIRNRNFSDTSRPDGLSLNFVWGLRGARPLRAIIARN